MAKFFKKALFGFGEEEIEKTPKKYKTYVQEIEGLPTYALKKRLTKIKEQVSLIGPNTLSDDLKADIATKLEPITSELKRRGEQVE